MIEINLVPDVKQELIRANRVRASVISLSIIVALSAAGAVIVLSLYVFGAQALRSGLLDGSISDQYKKLQNVKDLDKALTVQQQVKSVADVYAATSVDSRLFDVLTTVVPAGTSITSFTLDTTAKTVTIEGQTAGYNNLDVLKKTILATKFVYQSKGDEATTPSKSVPLATQVDDGDRNLGQDENGNQVLRFSISFAYPDELFSRNSISGQIVAPSVTNATDSKLDIPASLFTTTNKGGQ